VRGKSCSMCGRVRHRRERKLLDDDEDGGGGGLRAGSRCDGDGVGTGWGAECEWRCPVAAFAARG